jgi:SAM-dependent methyltransferase
MESFSADWLALREPADHAARTHALTADVAARLSRQARTRAIDLAGGTGSNIRYLLPRVPHITHWTLADYDPALLAVGARTLEPVARARGVTIETRRLDLADLDALPLDGCALVTASALLDLVSERWLRTFARRCRDARVQVLCALSYDGRIACEPRDPGDERIRALVNAHQRTDKGFGPALGPDAVGAAEDAFAGWETQVSSSDWQLDAGTAELQRQLVAGWAGAARVMAPADVLVIDGWAARRLGQIEAGRSRIVVGHRDFAAFDESVR